MAGNSTFTINGNKGEVLFEGNTAEVGGAVYVSAGAAVLMQGNKAGVSFSHNNAGRYGGALYAAGKVELNDNSFVSFADNSAEQGAAIYAESTAQVDICGNDSVTFTMTQEGNNPIYLNENAVLNLNNNGQVVFNTYTKPNHTALYAAAGAQVNMCGNVQVAVNECESSKAAVISCAGSLSIDANTGGVTVKDNAALGSDCGVIYLEGAAAAMSVSGNQGGVQISGNFALNGAGVIYADHADSVIRICNNTEVTVTENSVNGGAGAIHTAGSLYVCNNSGKVIFGNNSVYDEVTNTTVLNSINASQAYFSAAGGGSIELRDAISIGSNLHLNADADGVAQNGEIKFTGRYTDAYILTHAGNVLDRDASRFSSVEGTISLHAGSLTVESQAVLEAWKLIVDAGKDAVVSLSDGGILRVLGQVTMGEDTTLSAGLPDADMLRLTELAPAPASIDDLIRETDIAGVLQCGQLTLSTGSTYALYGGILDLGGAALNLEGTQNLTITGSNQAVQIGDEKVLLLFSGVTYCDASDAVLLYNGHSYTEENIIFDASRNVVYLTGIVPEPGTSVLTLTAFIGILLRRKRA